MLNEKGNESNTISMIPCLKFLSTYIRKYIKHREKTLEAHIHTIIKWLSVDFHFLPFGQSLVSDFSTTHINYLSAKNYFKVNDEYFRGQ